MLCHHLRWQKFLQQTAIKQQRQGSPQAACRYRQFGSLSAAAVICQHTPQNPSPAPGTGAKHSPWWVQNTGTASPTLCAPVCQGIISSQSVTALRQPSLAPSTLTIPSTCSPGIYRGAAEDLLQICISSYPKTSRGFTPPDQFRLGLREAGKAPSLPSRGSVTTQGALTEPQEQQFHKGIPSAPSLELQPCEWLTGCFRGATPAAILLWN